MSTEPESLPLRGHVVRLKRFSVRLNVRSIKLCAALTVAMLLVGMVSLSVGDFAIPLGDVAKTLFGSSTEDAKFIVGTLRLPRALVAIGVGAALGMSGAIFQSLVKNPLGSPDIIGFNSGAALGAVMAILLFQGSSALVSLGAVTGGILTAVVVYVLAWRRGIQAYRLVLVGLGAAFALDAGVDYLVTRAEINEVQRAAVWLTGSLNGRSWDEVRVIVIALAALGPAAILAQRQLDRLELGDDTAATLGLRINRTKFTLIMIAVVLSSLAVASAGPILFVAFVSGPLARRLSGSPGAAVVSAGFVGAMITLLADLSARQLFPVELPVGIMTAVIGAPYLLWLLYRQSPTGAL